MKQIRLAQLGIIFYAALVIYHQILLCSVVKGGLSSDPYDQAQVWLDQICHALIDEARWISALSYC